MKGADEDTIDAMKRFKVLTKRSDLSLSDCDAAILWLSSAITGERSAWLPIETAPDCTDVQVYGDDEPPHLSQPWQTVARRINGKWYLSIPGDYADDDGTLRPLLWQPLPAPPVTKSNAEPTYNHTRGDSPIYPCTICRGILLAKDKL